MSGIQFVTSHRLRMSQYYRFHSRIYDATRWMFLFGRTHIIEDLVIRPNEVVLEIGCGTGRNFAPVQVRLAGRGRLIGVDCSSPMLALAERRVRRNGWKNVELIDREYGSEPIARGQSDVVVMSYSLSMMPNWHQVLKCAKAELKPTGRIGIVDFCSEQENGGAARAFETWLKLNHVNVDRPYSNVLNAMFDRASFESTAAFGGLWSYFRFRGFNTMRRNQDALQPFGVNNASDTAPSTLVKTGAIARGL